MNDEQKIQHAHNMADAAAGGWRDGVRYMVESGAVAVPEGYALVPVEPTPEMVSAAEEAHMPFGDMDIALRMAILSAPDAAPARGQQVERWIPVSERLPDHRKPVAVWCSGSESAGVAWVCQGTWYMPEPQALGYETITHWQPLPTAPTRGDV